ncbi:MFS transporter [Methylovirgula sp. 4M-Z18]|uniref:MFS transporter n=1 Tax=Methylovirgula sp. 4M-Z18 TaxID=2293567 RepID=UPI000E2FC3ED|nr:MFS transporter [Methylovirgula sp. 4M-Z18]RFB75683.1 MFS transporter [Methylovirgula sp. 4M-Z18]
MSQPEQSSTAGAVPQQNVDSISTLIGTLAIATGAIVANLYYAQPLVAKIAPEIGIGPNLAGLIVSLTQIGYGLGLILLVPLADLIENRILTLTTLACVVVSLLTAAMAHGVWLFLFASLATGVFSAGAQILVPFVTHFVPVHRRGRTVGLVMAGLLTGIMLARPASLFIAAELNWRAVFFASAALMLVIGLVLWRIMPAYQPAGTNHYKAVLSSLPGLVRHTPVLRRRATYQTLLFCAFNLFWTAAPLMLAERFGLSDYQIGLFALAGAGGAFAAPLAGRLADHGFGRAATFGAMGSLALAFLCTGWATAALSLAILIVATLVIDAAVQTNQIVSQRAIFSTPPAVRARVNALYMTTVFIGGATGSVLGTLTYHAGGWIVTAATGAALGLAGLIAFATDKHNHHAAH